MPDLLDELTSKVFWNSPSRHPNITMMNILAHPKLPWDVDGIACNPKCMLEFVLQHPEWKWNWNLLLQNSNIPIHAGTIV